MTYLLAATIISTALINILKNDASYIRQMQSFFSYIIIPVQQSFPIHPELHLQRLGSLHSAQFPQASGQLAMKKFKLFSQLYYVIIITLFILT